MKTKLIILYISGMAAILLPSSCKKFLDAKPASNYATVSSISDAQLIMDNSQSINIANGPISYGDVSSDNFYFNQSVFDSNYGEGSAEEQLYIWGQYPYLNFDPSITKWATTYSSIMIFNTALDALEKIKPDATNRLAYSNAKGCALAFRGYFFWKLATVFSKAYREESAGSDLGIPLRLNININETSKRATVQQTYDQIIKDLTEAVELLPDIPTVITRPSKVSAYAMLAEVFLSMRNYDQALNYADLSLNIKNDLINYNALSTTLTFPIITPTANSEILCYFASGYGIPPNRTIVDSNLYKSYKSSDLRKKVFYRANTDGTYYFSNPYSRSASTPFTGPTTSEMYLVRAECLARKSDVSGAMQDLNALMENRIVNTTSNPYIPYTASSSVETLELILIERRKELAFRDLRWVDLKRLNAEGANITLTKNLSGKTYTLLPNDNRYALQLPLEVVQITGIQQNPYP